MEQKYIAIMIGVSYRTIFWTILIQSFPFKLQDLICDYISPLVFLH
jgi:hypothetical protein